MKPPFALAGSGCCGATLGYATVELYGTAALAVIIAVSGALALYGHLRYPIDFRDPPLEPSDPWFWVACGVSPLLILTAAALLADGAREGAALLLLTTLWQAGQTIGTVVENRRDAAGE